MDAARSGSCDWPARLVPADLYWLYELLLQCFFKDHIDCEFDDIVS